MSPAYPEPVAIAVFAKAPLPGEAKTRLIPRLGAEAAADLQAAMARRAVAAAVQAGVGSVSLWCWPDTEHPLFRELQGQGGVELRRQRGGDLGERMLACFAALCASGPAVLMGSDCPALDAAALRLAAAALRDGRDAVFLPAEDGGYVLAGLQRPEPTLFAGLEWGGAKVMGETRRRLASLGWKWAEPCCLWDVDRPEDVDRLRMSGFLNEWFLETGA